MKHKLSFGFTAVELIVTLLVIGIIASITTVGYNRSQTKAKSEQNKTLAQEIHTKAESYKSVAGEYPTLEQLKTGHPEAPESKIDNPNSVYNATRSEQTVQIFLYQDGKRVIYRHCQDTAQISVFWYNFYDNKVVKIGQCD